MTSLTSISNPLKYPLQGSALIEASAGTGKTYTLALLYVRLVLQQGGDLAFQQALLPPQILVVTFTRAATKELRERIRQRLVETAQFLRQDFSSAPLAEADPLLVELRNELLLEQEVAEDDAEAARKALATAAYKLELAAQYMDEAAISTIHSWCYRMLKEYAFNSGSLFQQELLEDETQLLQQACEDYWRIFYLPLAEEQLAEIRECFSSPSATREQVFRLLANLDLIEKPDLAPDKILAETAKRHAAELAKIKATWNEQELLPLLVSTFEAANKEKAYNARSLNSKHRADITSKLETWLVTEQQVSTGIDYMKSNSYKRLALLDTSIWSKDATIPYKNPACEALAALPEQLANLPCSFSDLLGHSVHWIAQRLEQLKAQFSQLSNQDLLTRLDAALQSSRGEQLAKAIRQQFPVALVDEFQDTDPVQYRIFKRIYQQSDKQPDKEQQPTAFFMIGDPKQAIYAFRGADIYTYLAAKKSTQGKHFSLEENFRSSPDLIAAVNSLFALGEQRPQGAFLFKTATENPVPFVSVKSGRKTNFWLEVEGKKQTALQAWLVPKDGNRLTKEAFTQQISQATASKIAQLLIAAEQQQAWLVEDAPTPSKRLLKPADIAVLVNNGTEADSLREELRLRGVASVYLSEKANVFASAASDLLLTLLLAINDPYDDQQVRKALALPQLGLSLYQLDELNTDELKWEAYLEEFLYYQRVWQVQGSLALVHRLIKGFDLAARLLAHTDGERQLTDLLHLGEILQRAEAELEGSAALIRYLQEEQANPSLSGDLQELRLESDSQLVQLVTVHKSKGLEYPLVFFPFATSSRNTKATDIPLKTHTAVGDLEIHLASSAEILAQAEEERLAEDLRKLYVALTRASHCQWLGLGDTAEFPTSAVGYLLGAPQQPDASLEQLVNQAELTHLEILPVTISEQVFIPQQEVELKPLLTPNTGQLTDWWIASYSAIEFKSAAGAELIAQEVAATASPDRDTANPKEEQREEEAKLAVNQETTAEEAHFTEIDTPTSPEEELGELSSANVLHHFPAGATWGTHLHSLLEWAGVQEFTSSDGQYLAGFAALVAENTASQQELYNFCKRRQLEDFYPYLWNWLVEFVHQEWQLTELNAEFSLASLQPHQFAIELEFMFESHQVNVQRLDAAIRAQTLNQVPRPLAVSNKLNGLLKGFIDLVVEHQGRYYVIDWKSNRLGATTAAYTPEAKQQQLVNHRYDMQYVLYLVALHRQLKARLPSYCYDQHIGGAIYVFLRGMQAGQQAGLFCDKPPRKLIEQLDALLEGKGNE